MHDQSNALQHNRFFEMDRNNAVIVETRGLLFSNTDYAHTRLKRYCRHTANRI